MRILHVFRSPVGGLFRHVRDLARSQHAAGHDVAIFCDSSTGGELAGTTLETMQSTCRLGIATAPISRLPSPKDFSAIGAVSHIIAKHSIDMVHCHGAKGGLIGRLAARQAKVPSVYTPHGGSLHFSWASVSGLAFLSAEKILSHLGDGFVFVCDFERDAFVKKIGLARRSSVVVNNALWPEEFLAPHLEDDATDLLFVGEVRHLKGIDILFDAVARLNSCSLTVVGDGPDLQTYKQQAQAKGLTQRVRFLGRLPMNEALSKGRILVVPSRHESFPYVVLEAVAAGTPVIASNVGGIPEVLPPQMMVPVGDAIALAAKINSYLADFTNTKLQAETVSGTMKNTKTAQKMGETIVDFYQKIIAQHVR